MKKDIILKTTVTFDAAVLDVWHALTDPGSIKKYLFGTDVKSQWKPGSDITWEGEWEGKKYKDKGQILKMEAPELLQYTYLSGLSGKEDKPENYTLVTNKLIQMGKNKTLLILTQDHNESKRSMEHSKTNWKMVFKKMKELFK